jgi:hypothetical protein
MKTAIDWLEEQLNERLHHLSNHKIHIKEFVRTAKSAEIRNILEIIYKAKEMERNYYICSKCKSKLDEKDMQQMQNRKKD